MIENFKKVHCNRLSIVICFSTLALFVIVMIVLFSFSCFRFQINTSSVSVTSIIAIISIVYSIFLCHRLVKKKELIIFISEKRTIYKDKERDLCFSNDSISKLTYQQGYQGFWDFQIHFFSGQIETFTLSRRNILKIGSLLDMTPLFNGISLTNKFKNDLSQLKKSLTVEKNRIIVSFIGLCFSITTIICYANYKHIKLLTTLFIVLSFTMGFLQVYLFYFKNKEFGMFGRAFLSFVSLMLFVVIIFTVIIIFSTIVLSNRFSYDLLVYTILLVPSFVIVIALLMLLIVGLGYM